MHNPQETTAVMSACGPMITAYNGSAENREMLKAFFLTLQVTHYLSCGMTKTVKPLLKQLQDCIQALTSQDGCHCSSINFSVRILRNNLTVFIPIFLEAALRFNPTGQSDEVFQWMPKEHLCLLVYLVSVYHAVQAGYIDRAQKFSEKALMQINGLKGTELQSYVF